MSNRPIGVFDSGVGGLTVLSKLQEALPNESVIYVGDTANLPYGGKSPKELLKHCRDIIKFLRGHNIKAAVLACGTTSSTVYEDLVAECPDIPLVDVIRPGVLACSKMASINPGLRLGMIATSATIKSGLFERMLKAQNPTLSFSSKVCPMFVPMVEAGIIESPITQWAAESYVGCWRNKIDALVLGCTHYPLLTNVLSKTLDNVEFINLAAYTVQALKDILTTTGSLNDGSHAPVCKYYVSGEPEAFNKTARFILPGGPDAVKII